jgi:hypothetical protein
MVPVAPGAVAHVGVRVLRGLNVLPQPCRVSLLGVDVENKLKAGRVERGAENFASGRINDFFFSPPETASRCWRWASS